MIEKLTVHTEIKEVDYEELVTRILELRESKDKINWDLGDIADITTKTFGGTILVDVARDSGIEIATLKRCRDVARAYLPKVRELYKILSWSHFRQVASRDDREDWLRRAADENWKVNKLAVMTKKDQSDVIDDGKLVPNKPTLELCRGCRRWYIGDKKQACPTRGQCPDVK